MAARDALARFARVQLPPWLWWSLRAICYPFALAWFHWPQCGAWYEAKRDCHNRCWRRRLHVGAHADFNGRWE